MSSFDFITDEELRRSLESDEKEVEKCTEAEAWKAVHVLVGSMIEAILADFLLTSGTQGLPKDDLLKMDLGKLIETCAKQKVLSPKTEGLSSAVRTYRNLIHPGRVIRLQEKVNKNGATVARALLQMVTDEISAKKREKCGFTAEQLIDKVIGDSSSVPIFPHLLDGTSEYEKRRLLLDVLPDRYFRIEAEPFDSYEVVEILPRLPECFRIAFGLSSDGTKSEVLAKFVSILKQESEHKVCTYEVKFFRAADLNYLPSQDHQIVKDHLLSRLDSGVTISLLGAIEGLGGFLEAPEAARLIDPLLRSFLYGKNETLKSTAQDAIVRAWGETESGGKAEEAMKRRLSDWLTHLQSKGLAEAAEKVRLIDEMCEIIPGLDEV
jgi:hypothetical protein